MSRAAQDSFEVVNKCVKISGRSAIKSTEGAWPCHVPMYFNIAAPVGAAN